MLAQKKVIIRVSGDKTRRHAAAYKALDFARVIDNNPECFAG